MVRRSCLQGTAAYTHSCLWSRHASSRKKGSSGSCTEGSALHQLLVVCGKQLPTSSILHLRTPMAKFACCLGLCKHACCTLVMFDHVWHCHVAPSRPCLCGMQGAPSWQSLGLMATQCCLSLVMAVSATCGGACSPRALSWHPPRLCRLWHRGTTPSDIPCCARHG